jgi:hypothetical protein
MLLRRKPKSTALVEDVDRLAKNLIHLDGQQVLDAAQRLQRRRT